MSFRKYNAITQILNQPVTVEVTDNCKGFAVRNIGGSVATVNGITLQPPPGPGLSGETLIVSGDQGEIYAGRIQIFFPTGAVNPLCELIQQFYIE